MFQQLDIYEESKLVPEYGRQGLNQEEQTVLPTPKFYI